MKLNKNVCLLNSTAVAKLFHFCIKLSVGALCIPLILKVIFCDQCWQTVYVLESVLRGAQHWSLQMWLRFVGSGCLPSCSWRSRGHLEVLWSALGFQPFSALANFRYIAELATKATRAKEFQPVLCSILQGSVSLAIKCLGYLRASTKSFKSWSAEPGFLCFLQEWNGGETKWVET